MEDTKVGQPRQPDKGRQKEARNELKNFVKRLRKVCDTISTVDEWTEIIGGLNRTLQIYQFEIPEVHRQNIAAATNLTEANRTGITQACDVLQIEIEKAIKALPSGGFSCGCLAGAVIGGLAAIVLAIVALVAAFVFLIPRVDVVVANQGCSPMLVRQGVPSAYDPVITFLRIELPDQIATNDQETIEFIPIPLTFNIDGTTDGMIGVSVLGIGQSFSYSERLADVVLNGQSLLGQTTSVNVRDQDPHTLEISCNP